MFDPLLDEDRKQHYKIIHYYGDSYKVRAKFSDGAGAYNAEWLTNNAGSIRVLIGDSELLFDAFDSIIGKP